MMVGYNISHFFLGRLSAAFVKNVMRESEISLEYPSIYLSYLSHVAFGPVP